MILGVYGPKNSGKTALIEKITKALAHKYKIATVKHIHHGGFTIDSEGTDTWRHARAGAKVVVASTEGETCFIVKETMDLGRVLGIVQRLLDADLILLEGFKGEDIPKVKVGTGEKVENTILEYSREGDEVIRCIETRLEEERRKREESHLEVRLEVDGIAVPIAKFVGDIMANAILGMVSSLKGVSNPRNVILEIVERDVSKSD